MASYPKTQQCRDWKFLWATAEGRRAIAALLSANGLFSPLFSDNPQIHAFNEGRRNVALDIVQMLQLKPEQFGEVAEAIRELTENG